MTLRTIFAKSVIIPNFVQSTADTMKKTKDIPLSTIQTIPDSGLFIKRFGQFGTTVMKPHAHRDDYYIFVLLTDGEAGVEIDFERRGLSTGDILIVSPWQGSRKARGREMGGGRMDAGAVAGAPLGVGHPCHRRVFDNAAAVPFCAGYCT